MLMIEPTNRFRKDYTKCKKRGLDVSLLDDVIEIIAGEEPLPYKYDNHKLSGNFNGCQECHIKSNWILIYFVDDERNMLILLRTGTHSDLFSDI